MNAFAGIVYFWIYFRLNTFLKTKIDEADNFTNYFSRAFGLIGLYFILIISVTLIFFPYPRVIGFVNWASDACIYLGISQIIICCLILLSSKAYFRFKKFVYILTSIAVVVHFFYHMRPSAEHAIMKDWAVISAISVPVFINIAPFFLWFLSFLVLSLIFLVSALRVEDGFVRKRSFLIGISILIFSLSYPLSRVLYYLDLPTLPPVISFVAGVFGLYILTSTSCVLGIYAMLQKKPTRTTN